jgi:hypothetical protein
MNVEAATITIDYYTARTAYKAYRQAITENRATKDDVAIARAYHAMLRGKKVLDVGAAIANAGVDNDTGLPRLAIARADWTTVRTSRPEWAYRFSNRGDGYGRRPKGEVIVRIPDAPTRLAVGPGRGPELGIGKAQVPMIPPQFRPTGPLGDYHLLFEAVWERKPPVDPLLLKQIGGPGSLLFVVLAAWDLTPLEQAVMRSHL